MAKYRLEIEELQVQSLVTASEEETAGLMSVYTRPVATTPIEEPGWTSACVPSQETCNCVTSPWC